MAESILDASRVVAGIGQGVATGVAEHVSVNWKGKAGARADALDQPIDGIGREASTALSGEDEGRFREVPAQLAQDSDLVADPPPASRIYCGPRTKRETGRACLPARIAGAAAAQIAAG